MLKYVSLAFWTALYFKSQSVWPAQNPEWSSRAVTLLHGLVATIVGSWLCDQPTLQGCCTERIGPIHNMLMLWSWGYFAFDLSWCMYYWPGNWLMLVHHGSALAAVTMYMGKPYSGCIFPCGLALMEITNPMLQARWFLRENGYDKTKIYLIVEVTYLFLFVVLRGGLGTYITFKVLHTAEFRFDDKIICVVLYFVSIALVSEIIGYVLYKYKTHFNEFRGVIIEAGTMLNYQF